MSLFLCAEFPWLHSLSKYCSSLRDGAQWCELSFMCEVETRFDVFPQSVFRCMSWNPFHGKTHKPYIVTQLLSVFSFPSLILFIPLSLTHEDYHGRGPMRIITEIG